MTRHEARRATKEATHRDLLSIVNSPAKYSLASTKLRPSDLFRAVPVALQLMRLLL